MLDKHLLDVVLLNESAAVVPAAITQAATNITSSAARINGKVTDDGGEACDVRFRWRETGGGEGGWVSPTGHNDPDEAWSNEANAYDGNTETLAETSPGYYDYLELTIDAISCDKVRIYCASDVEGHAINADIDIDVYYSGEWHNIHSGEVTHSTWVEKSIGSTQTVTKTRVKKNTAYWTYIYEFEFNELVSAWTTLDWDETGYSTDDTFYHDLSGLDSGTEYEFQVQARNSAGEGDWSASATFWTIMLLSLTDGLAAGDTLVRSMAAGLSVLEGLKGGDAFTQHSLAELLATDGTKIGDSALRTMLALLLSSEGVTTGDSRSILTQLLSTEGFKAGDDATRQMLASLLASEGVKIGDSSALTMTYLLLLAEGIKGGDEAIALMTASPSLIDGLKVGDSSAISAVANLLAADGIVLSDQQVIDLAGFLLSLVDGLKVGDTPALEVAAFLAILEGIKAGDSTILNLLLYLSLADTTKIGDAAQIFPMLVLADGLKAGDTSVLSMLATISLAEGIKIGDTPLPVVIGNYFLAISDGLKAGDTTLVEMLTGLSISDGVKFGDSGLVNKLALLLVSDGVKLGDVPASTLLALLSITEGAKIGDSVILDLIVAIQLAISEGLTVGDVPGLAMTALLATLDAIKLGDLATVGTLGKLLKLWLSTKTYHDVEITTKTYHDLEVCTKTYHDVTIWTGDGDMTTRRDWHRGETVPIWAEVKLESTGALHDPDQGVLITATDSAGTTVLDVQAMTKSEVGKYVYYWNSPVDAILGWYRCSGKAQDGAGSTAKITIEHGGFQLFE